MGQMKDPAPSRLAYKLNRIMLRPWVRRFLRYGLPVLILASGVAFWGSDQGRRDGAMDRMAEVKRQIEERPEFMVRLMVVEDASPNVAADIREVLSMDFPVSSFDLDLSGLQEAVETLDAVADASVRIRSGGVLEIEVEERVPSVIWREEDALVLLDLTGHPVAALSDRMARSDLPLIVGAGADTKVEEAMALFAAALPIRDRLRGFLRVGERRWDVVLDRDQRIMLPESEAAAAMEKVIALDQAQDLLERDLSVVDFRNPGRPVLRLGVGASDILFETGFVAE
ncbi:cell division protein FtsQ/DivIB [Rhodobacteraceae bacterium]|nr:cell division protein FtsQ/DivIB [Paracoccaceae bacterium]